MCVQRLSTCYFISSYLRINLIMISRYKVYFHQHLFERALLKNSGLLGIFFPAILYCVNVRCSLVWSQQISHLLIKCSLPTAVWQHKMSYQLNYFVSTRSALIIQKRIVGRDGEWNYLGSGVEEENRQNTDWLTLQEGSAQPSNSNTAGYPTYVSLKDRNVFP